MITLAVVALHSVILRTFSGNSLVAEIHSQIFLVSSCCPPLVTRDFPVFTDERHKSWERAAAIINRTILSG